MSLWFYWTKAVREKAASGHIEKKVEQKKSKENKIERRVEVN